MNNIHENLVESAASKIKAGWDESRQNALIERLSAGEELQTIMESFPGFKETFRDLDTIDCSDGRVLDGHKIGIAGSGCLLSDEERAKFVEAYRGKIKKLTTHRDCGAAAKKFAALQPEEIPAGVKTSDEHGTWCGKKLAAELGAEHEFLDMKDMANDYHNETAIVLDQTGKFDSTNLAGFPAHFVCTGAGLGFSEGYMKSELATLAGIALGHHGFGERFTKQNPFYILVAANSYPELSHWEGVAREAISEFDERVIVRGFVRPDESKKN